MSLKNEACLLRTSHGAHHLWMSLVAWKYVMALINESCHMGMSHARRNEACHMGMTKLTRSCRHPHHFQAGDVTHPYVACLIPTWHASFLYEMPHSYMTCLISTWYVLFLHDITGSWVPSPILFPTRSHASSPMWHASFLCDMPRY